MKPIISILFLLGTFSSFTTAPAPTLEEEKYLNYVSAIENESTFGFFTVIKIKNINSSEVKEVCVKGQLFLGALHKELNLAYSESDLNKVLEFAKSKKDRYFELKNQAALDNINFSGYDLRQLKKLKLKYNFSNVEDKIKKNHEYDKRLPKDEMKAFAHILFNKGILTGESNCWGGTIRYVDRNNWH